MLDRRAAAIRENFDYFQGIVASLMEEHAGKYALLHDQSVIGIFNRPIEALNAGRDKFDDDPFSIQRVIDRPLDLGFMSYGAGDRAPY